MSEIEFVEYTCSELSNETEIYNLYTAPSFGEAFAPVHSHKLSLLSVKRMALLGIIATNLQTDPQLHRHIPYKSVPSRMKVRNLKQEYSTLKREYLRQLDKTTYLTQAIAQVETGKISCNDCSEAQNRCEQTKRALEDSIEFSMIVLKQLYRDAS